MNTGESDSNMSFNDPLKEVSKILSSIKNIFKDEP